MFRSTRLVVAGAAAFLVGVLLSPVAAAPDTATPAKAPGGFTATAEGGAMIAVNSKGTANNESTDPSRTAYTFPMFSLATGEEIGTITDDIGPSSTPTVMDVTTTYRFPDGEIVSRMLVSIAQDPQKPGWIIVGNRPESDTIISATGAYAGRTGRVRLSGVDDVTQFPETVFQDDFWVIELNP